MKKKLLTSFVLFFLFNCFSQQTSLPEVKILIEEYRLIEAQKRIKTNLSAANLSQTTKAELLNLSGEIGLKLGNYSDALTNYSTAKELCSINKEKYAQVLGNIGIAHWKLGNLEASYDNLTQSTSILEKLGLENLLADATNNLGLIWSETNTVKALDYYKEALSIYQKNGNQEKYLLTNNNIGIIYRNQGQYYLALNIFQESLEKIKSSKEKNNLQQAFTEANIAQTYLLINEADVALTHFNSSLAVYEKVLGSSHPELASIHGQIAGIYSDKNDFTLALKEIELATIANTKDENLNTYYDRKLQISILLQHAEIFLRKFRVKSLSPKDVKQALNYLINCDKLIQEQRNFLFNKKDKIAFNAQAREVYECEMECLGILTNEPFARKRGYLNLAFELIEKSKASTLLSSLQDSEAKKFGGVPPDTLLKENELTSSIAFLERQLSESRANTEKEIRTKLSQERANYRDFTKSLELNYPKYFELKYSHKFLTPTEVQSKLKPTELMVNYFFSEREQKIIAFKISKQKTWIESRQIKDELNKDLVLFKNCMKFNVPLGFKSVSYRLTKQFMLDRVSEKISSIAVIPDGKLNTIPFEALIEKPKKEHLSFNQMPYLIKKHEIYYHFSASLWGKNSDREVQNELTFHCLSPIYFEKDHDFPDLPGTENEAKGLDSLFKAHAYLTGSYLGASATEDNLHTFTRGNILHIPTHGQVFSSTPEKSRLLLAKKDSTEDGFLYLGEVYNSTFNYDFISLSACQTGLGKQSKGEGVIGLSRAFIYAGAKNILVSYWSVDDASTAELMLNFYSNYLTKEPTSFLSSLTQAKAKMATSKNYANPHFWAPFILIGR